jgi:hypothetical protein
VSGRKDLAARRAELLERAEAQRVEMAAQWRSWRPVFQGIDRGVAAAGWLRRHAPGIATFAGIGAMVFGLARPRFAAGLIAASPALRIGGALFRVLSTVRSARKRRH